MTSFDDFASFGGFFCSLTGVMTNLSEGFDIAVDIIHVNRVAGFGVHDVADTADVAGNDGEASTGNLEEDIRETVGLGSIEEGVVVREVEAVNSVIGSLVGDGRGKVSEEITGVGALGATIGVDEVFGGAFVFRGVKFCGDLLQKIGALLRTDAASPEDAEGSIGILFGGFCELRVIGLVGGGIKFFWHDRGEEFGGLEMGEDFFGRETGALLDGGSERGIVGEDFGDSRGEIANPGIDKTNDQARVLVILVHELGDIKLVVVVGEEGEMVFSPEEGELVMDEVEALNFGLDDEAGEDKIGFEPAAATHNAIKINKVNVIGDFVGVFFGERGEDHDMPVGVELGEGVEIVREDFFGAADGEGGREEEVVGVFADLGDEATVEGGEVVEI